jgi:tRNA U34 5-methylaminomethyl-2-thiouridine-forming methyltransferase MnmC
MINKEYKREIIITEDGSSTLSIPEIDEHYHSIHGAIQESNHIFINSGFNYLKERRSINILEIGFGTGLNAFLTYIKATENNIAVNYTSIEKYPITNNEIEKLNYSDNIDTQMKDVFKQIHNVSWESFQNINNLFKIKKVKIDLLDYLFEDKYDLIYFDAFSPNIQPKLWSADIFSSIYTNTNAGGVLVTYSAKGQVRRNMQAAGFKVSRLPGPPGKREILRAVK